jgi:quinol monooxygenase YgiN
MIFITAKFQVRPQDAGQWPQIAAEFTQATRSEPGCLWFEWSRSLADPDEYVLVEAFRDEAAGGAHVQSDHFRKAQQTLPDPSGPDAPYRQRHRPPGRLVPARGAGRPRLGLTSRSRLPSGPAPARPARAEDRVAFLR